MNLLDYRNIIFDFGGVILNLDYKRTIDAFENLGLTDFQNNYSQLDQTDLFDCFERGEISPIVFRNGLRTVFENKIDDNALDAAWNAMLLNLPKERLQVLDELKKEMRISLLSNTNEIHVKAFEAELHQVHGMSDLTGIFEKVYYSCRMGMRKPEPRIFKFVVDQQNYIPSETLFIDDSPQHIEGAKAIGLNTYHLRADLGETILDLY